MQMLILNQLGQLWGNISDWLLSAEFHPLLKIQSLSDGQGKLKE